MMAPHDVSTQENTVTKICRMDCSYKIEAHTTKSFDVSHYTQKEYQTLLLRKELPIQVEAMSLALSVEGGSSICPVSIML
jgi:hypothetical protein